MDTTYFLQAKPVWETGKETEMNYFLRLFSTITKNKATMTITACNIYRVFVNDCFVTSGPARAAHEYYRVDEVVLDSYLTKPINEVRIEVGAYNVNSFEYLDEPGFIQCEIRCENEVLAATGRNGFRAERMLDKVQKTQRYSFQRTFCEEYYLPMEGQEVELCVVGEKKLLPRRVEHESYKKREINHTVVRGTACRKEKNEQKVYSRFIENISPQFKGYRKEELTSFIMGEMDSLQFQKETKEEACNESETVTFGHGQYCIFDVGINSTGYLCSTVTVKEAVQLYFIFDEILVDDEVDCTRMDCGNVVKYHLQKGEYELQSFEPYTFQYIKVLVMDGECELSKFHLKQVINPYEIPAYQGNDSDMEAIYNAAVETFRQNAVDIYMDCPSRERAGWLCDSFFTSRVEYALTGQSVIERNFLENYLLPEKFAHLPKGMLPMCYPSDHTDGVFIPNWAMWLVLELEEYKKRSDDVMMTQAFRKKVYDLLTYFEQFENEDGLLERLEGWVFVEWSECNQLTQDVNYPSNMLYYKMLLAVARLYQDESLIEKANHIRQAIRSQSKQGQFFVENAVRKENQLQLTGNITETCQYYAFFCGVATIEEDAQLWTTLTKEFGPERKKTKAYPEVFYSNAFIGNYLRLEILKNNGYYDKVMAEIKGYFTYMAKRTHTLWEHDQETASCNHGFASYVICLIEEERTA